MHIIIQLILSAVVSVIAVHWIFLRILKIAKVKGLVDNPDARKLQKSPVPVLGGIAVFFGLVTGLLAYAALNKVWPVGSGLMGTPVLPIMLCGSVMLYVGSMDDILGLSPKSRLIIEVLAMLGLIFGSGMCVDSLHGLWGVNEFSWWIGVPLTIFAGVGLINAYNMVDGVNGLSSGLCIAGSCLLSAICFKRADYANCALALCFAGALLPFLLHNVFGKRSRMFIGDGGTMVMGMLVSWFMIRILSGNNAETLARLALGGRELGLVAMMLAVACVPVFDTLRVMTARVLRHESPFHADKTHLHHAFIALGVSHSITSLSEILINLMVVAIWFVTYRLGASVDVQLYVVIAAAVALVWGSYFFLSRVMKNHPDSPLLLWAKKTHLGHTDWWLAFQKWLDKGAYEDYYILFKQKMNKKMEDMDNKEKDTVAIVNYMQGKKKVKVEDIIKESGADKLRVYTILFELEQDHIIDVLVREPLGAAEVVTLNDLGGGI